METYKITKTDMEDMFDHDSRMADIFTWLEGEFAIQGKLICQFIVNGQELSEKDELDWAGRPYTVAQDIQVKVKGEKDLVIDVLEAWIDAIPELTQFIETRLVAAPGGAQQFRIEDIMEFNNQQESFVESLMSLKLPLKRMGLNMTAWNTAEKSLHAYVLQCVKFVETKNFVQLIETLEYDGSRVLEEWRKLLAQIKDEAQSFDKNTSDTVFNPTQSGKIKP